MVKLFYFEWLHFSRNSARPIAVMLFLLAAVFALYNGFSSYQERLAEIESIHDRKAESIQEVNDWFD